MTKAIVVLYSKSYGKRDIYNKPTHDEKTFLDELNTGVMRKSGARLVSYSGDRTSGFKAVIEIDN